MAVRRSNFRYKVEQVDIRECIIGVVNVVSSCQHCSTAAGGDRQPGATPFAGRTGTVSLFFRSVLVLG